MSWEQASRGNSGGWGDAGASGGGPGPGGVLDAAAASSYEAKAEKVKKGLATVSTLVGAISSTKSNIGGAKDSVALRSKMKELIGATKKHIKEVEGALEMLAEHAAVPEVGNPFDDRPAAAATSKPDKLRMAVVNKLRHDLEKQKKRYDTERQAAELADRRVRPPTNSVGSQGEFDAAGADGGGSRAGSQEGMFVEREQAMKQFEGVTEEEIQVNANILAERESAINDINKTLVQVNTIFKELAELVDEQGAGIEEVANNVEVTADRAVKGLDELKEADRLNRKRSGCIIA